jgi:hypothetical protein
MCIDMSTCPSLERLLQFLHGEILKEERAAVERHLAEGCRHCEEEQSWLAAVLDLTASDHSFEFSDDVIDRTVERFTAAFPRPSLLDRVRASLTFDSYQMQPLLGLRNGPAAQGTPAERQMLFQTDSYNVDLRFEAVQVAQGDGDFENLIGQILPATESQEFIVFTVRLIRDGVEVGQAVTNEHGMFKFNRIPSGVYRLQVAVPEGEILLEDVRSARCSEI